MKTKITVDLSQGIIEAEGDKEFVSEVYRDFKNKLLDGVRFQGSGGVKNNKVTRSNTPASSGAKSSSKSKKTQSGDTGGVNPDSPALDKNLDTSGLPKFYAQFAPRSHAEKILIFLKFLTEEAGLGSPNTDHVYTCYQAVKEKPAAAFAQAFRDTSSKKHGYIDYKSATDISVTFIGNRYFDHDLKRAEVE